MQQEIDLSIHQFNARLNGELLRVESLDSTNKKSILDFYEKHCIKNRIQAGTTAKELSILRLVAEKTKKPLNKFSEKDLEQLNIQLSKEKKKNGKPLRLSTISDYRKVLKTFFLLNKSKLANSKELKKINYYKLNDYMINPSDLPNAEQTRQLFDHLTPRYRALLALLYGAGLRISSALTLHRSDVVADDGGSIIINFTSKTGRNSVKLRPDLASFVLNWLDQSKFKDSNDFVFTEDGSRPLCYQPAARAIFEAKKSAKLPEHIKVNPHAFRHAHASWALTNMPVSLAKKRLWGNLKTNMEHIYTHITKEQEFSAYDEAVGTKNGESKKLERDKEGALFLTKICFICGSVYGNSSSYCTKCNISLDAKTVWEEREKNFNEQIGELKQAVELLWTEVKTKKKG